VALVQTAQSMDSHRRVLSLIWHDSQHRRCIGIHQGGGETSRAMASLRVAPGLSVQGVPVVSVRLAVAQYSWMFWPNKGVAGYFDRDPGLIMKELGLPHRKQTDHLHMTSPHVLALQSGNWDVQERPVTSFEQEMPKFLAILRAWLPQTRIIWLGPLHLKVKGEAWRTSFRLEEHARMLSRLLRPHDIPLITAHSMYSAIDNTCDGRHFELQYYLDWFNLLLNEWLRVDDEVVRRLLPVSDLSTRTPG